MSKTPSVPNLPELPTGATLDQVVSWLQTLRTQNLAREPASVGSPLMKFVTRGELVGTNLLQYSNGVVSAGSAAGGTTIIGGGGNGGGGAIPDLTPPSPITSLTVTAGLTNFFVEFDAPTYSQGHGNAYTSIYAANYSGTGALPTFSDAVEVYQVTGSATIAIIPAQIGTTTCFWAGAVTNDGVRQVDGVGPTGGLHGADGTTGVIGTTDLGPLIVEAGNLANGAVTASKLAAAAVTATSFASSIQPITIVSTIPGSFVTSTVFDTTDGKLYRWDGSVYTKSVPTTDLSGQITTTQITPNSITTALLAAGSVTTAVLAAGAVTAGNIAANSITAGQIAAGAIGAAEISAGAITTSKLAVADFTNFIANPKGDSAEGWQGLPVSPTSMSGVTFWPAASASTTCIVFDSRDGFFGPKFSCAQGDEFFCSMDSESSGGGASIYDHAIGVAFVDVNGAFLAFIAGGVRSAGTSGVVTVSGSVTAPANTASALVWVQVNGPNGTSFAGLAGKEHYATNMQVRRMNSASLIVDGAITANKIAANAIAVGTAAIENGAIVNAMIGNAEIDNAKIADLSAGKLTSGSIAVGETIASTGYVPGSAGWAIAGNGNAEFSFAMVRGTLLSSQVSANSITSTMINGSGLIIRDNSGTPILGVGNSLPLSYTNAGAINSNITVDGSGLLQGIGTGAGTAVANSLLTSSISDKLSKSAPSVLSSTVSINATAGAGFVAGTLSWDSSGNRTGGSGVAMTPGGIVAYNGSTATFTLNASTGDAFFAGKLQSGVATKSSSSTTLHSVTTITGAATSISSGTINGIVTTTSGGDLLLICNLNVYLNTNTNTPYDFVLDLRCDGTSLFGSSNPQPLIIGTMSNVRIGGATYNWAVANNFDLSIEIPAGTLTAGSHTFSYNVNAIYFTATGSPNTITGSSLACDGQMMLTEKLA